MVSAGTYAPSAATSAPGDAVQGAGRGDQCSATACRPPPIHISAGRGGGDSQLGTACGEADHHAPEHGSLSNSALGDSFSAHLAAPAFFNDDPRRNVRPREHVAAEPLPAEYDPRSRRVRLANPGGSAESPACSTSGFAAPSRVCDPCRASDAYRSGDPQLAVSLVQADRVPITPDHDARETRGEWRAADDVQAEHARGSGEAPDYKDPAKTPTEAPWTRRVDRAEKGRRNRVDSLSNRPEVV